VTPEPLTASVTVAAEPADVYEYFTRSELIVEWMGETASLHPRPGGELAIVIRGAHVRGRYLALDPPHRLVFSWGFLDSQEVPPEASTVEVTLSKVPAGTHVEVVHHGLPEPRRTEHSRGWRLFLDQLESSLRG